jgi:isopentenyl-diphosphate delta-isomerase
MNEEVILVDENDQEVGTMEKMEAHRKGVLHRAFSILLFNSKGQVLLQKRAADKYHSAGQWTNTCCSHPRPGENLDEAVRRRLREEMGIDLQPQFAYRFTYKAKISDDLTEHELDHVFLGSFDGKPIINTHEVQDWKFADLSEIRTDMLRNPDSYTPWFKLIIRHPRGEAIAVS